MLLQFSIRESLERFLQLAQSYIEAEGTEISEMWAW